MDLLIAFATDNGTTFTDGHFGQAKYFYIYRFFDDGEELVEKRPNIPFQGDTSKKHGDPAKARATSRVLDGADVLVNTKFGPNITRLVKKFVCVVVRTRSINDAVEIIKSRLDEVIEEKKKTADQRHLVFKDSPAKE